jgi:hypothetical protein
VKIKTCRTQEFNISIVGYSDAPGVGYVRFEDRKKKEYLGAIDVSTHLRPLKKLRDALNDMIKQKEKK